MRLASQEELAVIVRTQQERIWELEERLTPMSKSINKRLQVQLKDKTREELIDLCASQAFANSICEIVRSENRELRELLSQFAEPHDCDKVDGKCWYMRKAQETLRKSTTEGD